MLLCQLWLENTKPGASDCLPQCQCTLRPMDSENPSLNCRAPVSERLMTIGAPWDWWSPQNHGKAMLYHDRFGELPNGLHQNHLIGEEDRLGPDDASDTV